MSDALTAASGVSKSTLDSLAHKFLHSACANGLGDYVKSTLSSSREHNEETMYDLMNYTLVDVAEPNPNTARYIISYAEANGLSSKDTFQEIFDYFLAYLRPRLGIPSRGRKDFSAIVRVIASTGYVLDEAFVTANFPQYYTELMSPGCASNRVKRALEDDGSEGTRMLARHH